ncbi:MAG: type II toxin-antitoxin system VapC family toxin [Crenarchaeota archaeon]|nr:type II toxin-antitoxin system VapC family toxin [Thermoproteota archaeon]
MIVIDASAVAKYLLREQGWGEVERYLVEDDVVSLDLMLKEVLNTIWKHAVILGTITRSLAEEKKQILYSLVEDGIILVEREEKYLDKAFSIALKNRVTIYDALYIAQALEHRATLLTSDKKQLETAQKLGAPAVYVP